MKDGVNKPHDFTPYVNALEEWDDIVGDSWEEPEIKEVKKEFI